MKATKKNRSELATIGADARVVGRIVGQEDLRVLGRVIGEIELSATLWVEQSGWLEANAKAAVVRVAGAIIGEVVASELIEVKATARVQGSLRAPRVAIAPGAQVFGPVRAERSAASRVPPPRVVPPPPLSEPPLSLSRAFEGHRDSEAPWGEDVAGRAPGYAAPAPAEAQASAAPAARPSRAPSGAPAALTHLGPLVPEELPAPRARVTPRGPGLEARVLRGDDEETRLPAPESTQILASPVPSDPPSGEAPRRRVLVRFRKRGEP